MKQQLQNCGLNIHDSLSYNTFLNKRLAPQFHSELKSIELITIAKSSVITKYRANSILKAFFNDLRVIKDVRYYLHGYFISLSFF